MTTLAQQDIPSRSRPIEKAILNRDMAEVRRLLESGQDIDQKMFNDETPAIMAATTNSWDIVLYLLQAGANPAAEDLMGLSIADMAETSRIAPHTKEWRALQEVNAILRERGLL